MNQLHFKPPVKKLVNSPVKKPVKKRTTPLNANNFIINKTPKNYMTLSNMPKLSYIYAYLLSETTAKFQNSTNDYFYKCLESLKSQHLDFLGEAPPNYNSPFDNIKFKFKSIKKFLYCRDKKGTILMWEKCIGNKVILKLRVKPYDFIHKTTKKRCVGLSIQVSEVMLL